MELRRKWGWVLLDGILGIVVGVLALLLPGLTVVALALLLGIGLLVQGVVQLGAGVTAFSGPTGRGWTIVFGVLALVAGIVCLARPGTALVAIAIGVAVWLIVAGINDITAAILVHEDRVWNGVVGVVSVIAGLVVVSQPGAGLSAAAFVTGLMFLIRGVLECALAWRLRSGGSPAATPRPGA